MATGLPCSRTAAGGVIEGEAAWSSLAAHRGIPTARGARVRREAPYVQFELRAHRSAFCRRHDACLRAGGVWGSSICCSSTANSNTSSSAISGFSPASVPRSSLQPSRSTRLRESGERLRWTCRAAGAVERPLSRSAALHPAYERCARPCDGHEAEHRLPVDHHVDRAVRAEFCTWRVPIRAGSDLPSPDQPRTDPVFRGKVGPGSFDTILLVNTDGELLVGDGRRLASLGPKGLAALLPRGKDDKPGAVFRSRGAHHGAGRPDLRHRTNSSLLRAVGR